LGLRPATGSSDAAPLEGCARVPSSAIEWARASLRFDFVKQPRGVRFTDGTLMSSWVSSDAFGSGIRRALGTAAPTVCMFAVGSAADGCRASGLGAGALPPDRVPCIVSKYSPRFPPDRTLCPKLAPAAVWPREIVRALSEQPKGSCRGLRPSGGAHGANKPYI
jgi:hypothetical protein